MPDLTENEIRELVNKAHAQIANRKASDWLRHFGQVALLQAIEDLLSQDGVSEALLRMFKTGLVLGIVAGRHGLAVVQ